MFDHFQSHVLTRYYLSSISHCLLEILCQLVILRVKLNYFF